MPARMPFVIGKNCKKATTLSTRERPDLFHGRRRRRLVPSARSGGFRRAAPNPLKPIPNYRRGRNKLKTNSSLSSGGGPRGPGPKNKSLPPPPRRLLGGRVHTCHEQCSYWAARPA